MRCNCELLNIENEEWRMDTCYNELLINQAEAGAPDDYIRLTYTDSLRADYYPCQCDINNTSCTTDTRIPSADFGQVTKYVSM